MSSLWLSRPFPISASLFFSLFLFLSLSPDLFIPRFLAPHALGVSIVSPCLAETRREARFGLESIDYPKKLLLRLRVLSILSLSLFLYLYLPLAPSWHARVP